MIIQFLGRLAPHECFYTYSPGLPRHVPGVGLPLGRQLAWQDTDSRDVADETVRTMTVGDAEALIPFAANGSVDAASGESVGYDAWRLLRDGGLLPARARVVAIVLGHVIARARYDARVAEVEEARRVVDAVTLLRESPLAGTEGDPFDA